MKKTSTEFSSGRRVFMLNVATTGLLIGAAANVSAQDMVSESDPQAAGLGYKTDATKVDKSKQPEYAAGQICGNCALYQGSGPVGGCSLFGAKKVAGPGWCSAWAKKA